MLTVPATIQALYQQDGVRKNFRASFPGGELDDITNADICKETLVFTESACSQDVFRFGLAEASKLEFETVGIGNIFGLLFNAFIEIDVSSLTAAQLAAIAADPGDGELVDVSNSDTGYGFYRIGLGRFQVTSCPRNQQAMTHRRVTAYNSASYWLTRLDAFERQKLSRGSGTGRMVYNIRNYLLAKMAAGGTDVLTENNLAATQIYTYSDGSAPAYQYYLNIPATPYPFWIRVTPQLFALGDDAIYGYANADSWDIRDTAASWLADYADANDITVTVPAGTTRAAYLADLVAQACSPLIFWLTSHWGALLPLRGENSPPLPDDLPAFYPRKYAAGCQLSIPATIDLVYGRLVSAAAQQTYTRPAAAKDITVSRWDKIDAGVTDPLEAVTVSFAATQTDTGTYTYIDAYDPAALINGALELEAQYATARRTVSGLGGMRLRGLDPSSPAEIGPTQIDELWWDEFDVEPIGSVTYTYKDKKGEEQTGSLDLGNGGGSIYDMTDNAVLKALPNPTAAAVEALITAAFAPHVQTATFTPIELAMPAWPWLEACDALQLTAADATVVNSYLLARTTEGVQIFMDGITAAGGEAIEEGTL